MWQFVFEDEMFNAENEETNYDTEVQHEEHPCDSADLQGLSVKSDRVNAPYKNGSVIIRATIS